MDSKNQPNEVESSIFSQVGSYAIWCANYDKKVYEKSKQEVLEDIGVTQKMILDILSLLEKLGYPMDELGTYFYERLILSVCESLNEIIKEKGYDIIVLNTICNATEERQTEAQAIAEQVDAMIVIGGRNSSNTQKLFEICKNECKNTYYIQTVKDLDLAEVRSVDNVGITAGASTPNNIIEEVQKNVRNEL